MTVSSILMVIVFMIFIAATWFYGQLEDQA